MSRADVARILDAFTEPEPERDGLPAGLSAVLIAIYETGAGPALLYTRRSEALRQHPGEIAFPGGRVDPGDDGPRAAALREAEEEVGLRREGLERVSHLTDYTTYRGTTVCVYVAHARGDPPPAPASKDEVAEVFLVPIASLLAPGAYEARRIDGMEEGRRVHYWHVERRIIWGITGEITARFLAKAAGWQMPDEVRTVGSVEDLVPRRAKRT